MKNIVRAIGVAVSSFFILAFPSLSFSQGVEPQANTEDHRMALDAYRSLLNETQFQRVDLLGFRDAISGSMTAVFRSNEDLDMFIAEIFRMPGGAQIHFRVYRDCQITSTPIPMVIVVNGQNIQATYACGAVPNQRSSTQEVYMTRTEAGQNYLVREFLNKRYVTAKLKNRAIPFSTEGFRRLWQAADKPAL